jgi:hypothetical protein
MTYTTSDSIKLALMMVYRFLRGANMVSTECGRYNSDVLVIDKSGTITEIEVKVSLQDFKADFRKPKHNIFEHAKSLKEGKWDRKLEFVPHYFYFAVPESIVTDVLPLLMNRPYGLISVPDIKLQPRVNWITANSYLKVIRKPIALRVHKATEPEKRLVLSRMSSELINAKINLVK